jgi:hypothetical protein
MTRKDYTLLAQTIEDAENDANNIWGLAMKLCRALREEDPNFNARIFLGKCGYSKNKIDGFLEDEGWNCPSAMEQLEERDRQKMMPPDKNWGLPG